MLTEEAHHMFVGETGIGRVVQRTCELMKEHDTDEVGRFGGIDLKLMQKYLNFHYSVSLDLFGAELSTNAANYFNMGVKGRFNEEARDDDHQLRQALYTITQVNEKRIIQQEQPALLALNETPPRRLYCGLCARCCPLEQGYQYSRNRFRTKAAASRIPSCDWRLRIGESHAGWTNYPLTPIGMPALAMATNRC